MSNVLNEQKKRQAIALGRLGWSRRRIQKATGVRRETSAAYIREAGVAVQSPGSWGRGAATPVASAGPPQANPAIKVTTDFGAELATSAGSRKTQPDTAGSAHAAGDLAANRVCVPSHKKLRVSTGECPEGQDPFKEHLTEKKAFG